MTPALRPYQLEQVEAVERFHLLHQTPRVMCVAATGTGKSVSVAEIVSRCVKQRGETVLFLAHRRELIDQMVEHMTRAGLIVGIERGSQRADAEPVVCASVQTMRGKRLEGFPHDAFDVIVVDECHHAAAQSYLDIFAHFPNARRVGVTATPDRADGKSLRSAFDHVVHRYEIDEAIDAGYLTPVRGIQITVPGMDLSKVRSRRQTRAGGEDSSEDTIDLLAPSGQARVLAAGERVSVDLHPKDLGRAVLAPEAVEGVVGPMLELAGERRTIVFAVDRAHAEAISDSINAKRPGAARWLYHKTPDRKQVQADHKAGKFQFLINVLLLTEGYDDPAIECVAMARPTQSRVIYSQAVGRALRLFAGKTLALLLDFVGVGCKFDLVGPEDALAGALSGEVERIGTKPEAKQKTEAKHEPVEDVELGPAGVVSIEKPVTRELSVVPEQAPAAPVKITFTTKVIELVRTRARAVGNWLRKGSK